MSILTRIIETVRMFTIMAKTPPSPTKLPRYIHSLFISTILSFPIGVKKTFSWNKNTIAESLAESFYNFKYGSSIIMSKVSQQISVMKT